MEKELTGVLVDVKRGVVERCTLDGSLQDFYRVLNCSRIDITTRILATREFDIVCDDEGLLKADARVSAFDRAGSPMLVGNLFFCSSDCEGNSVSITDDDIEFIMDHAICIGSPQGGEWREWHAVFDVEYC